jgi:hypothetical protein
MTAPAPAGRARAEGEIANREGLDRIRKRGGGKIAKQVRRRLADSIAGK